MKEEIRKVYHCDFCKRVSTNRGAMVIHEKACKKNPANIPLCFGCYWFNESDWEETITYRDPETDMKRSVSIAVKTCKLTGNEMFWKLFGSKAKAVESKGWVRCPMQTGSCEGFLSFDEAKEIKKHLLESKPEYKKDIFYRIFSDVELTPEMVKKYRDEGTVSD